MLSTLVAERYAKALLAAAEDAKAVDAVETDARALQASLDSDATLKRYLAQPLVGAKEKTRVFAQALAGASPTFLTFLKAVFEAKRGGFLLGILKRFEILAEERREVLRAGLTSPSPLSGEALAALELGLSRSLGRKVSLTLAVDPALLGGLRLKVGDLVYDGSLEAQLKKLAGELKRSRN